MPTTTHSEQPPRLARTPSVESSSPSSLTNSVRRIRLEHGSERSRVLPPSQELWKRARETRAAMNFRQLTDLTVSAWRWKASSNGFTIFKREVAEKQAASMHEVLSAGEIRCSVAELVHILRPEDEAEHNAVMQALYRKDYIYGSSARVVPVAASDPAAPVEPQLAVKTSTFVRANVLAKHEQWCYLEHFQHTKAADPGAGFTVTIASMREDELRAGKSAGRERVNDLHGVVAGYLVERVPRESLLRVLFYAQFTDATSAGVKGLASSGTTRARLAFLAKGAARLPEVVRRRRLGAQTFADRAAFAASNTRCVCCTKSLRLFSKKKRCALCGYFVCDKDWSIQSVETRSGGVTAARVCARCMEAVEYCDYSELPARELGAPLVVATPAGRAPPAATVATFLHDALESAGSAARKESVKAVIKHLVAQEPQAHEQAAKAVLTPTSNEREYHAALDAYLTVEAPPLDACVLANAAGRSYGISVPEHPAAADADAPAHPVGANEAERLRAIERGCIDQIGLADEFNIIAALAARELECRAGLVTVITEREQIAQYATMRKLADTASRVMQLKGQEIEARSWADTTPASAPAHVLYKQL
ncbi:hypothetical protein PybrP1_006272 [[Pythium] brassicae (nom. inval.)]|nr:hypothetical protein PybrP1_006272 [[Pythium] brassicae (nom. inval.)]